MKASFNRSLKNLAVQLDQLVRGRLWLKVLIALALGVDRILDMCRTSVNVLGDVVACTTVQYLTKKSSSLQQSVGFITDTKNNESYADSKVQQKEDKEKESTP